MCLFKIQLNSGEDNLSDSDNDSDASDDIPGSKKQRASGFHGVMIPFIGEDKQRHPRLLKCVYCLRGDVGYR